MDTTTIVMYYVQL